MIWKVWWELVCELRTACARTQTFLWMGVCLAGMTTRKDLMGVTSIVRALGLLPACYDRLLDFFHSPALDLAKLTRAWRALSRRCALRRFILSVVACARAARRARSTRKSASQPASLGTR